MTIQKIIGVVSALALVAGCSTPKLKGDSLQNQKQLSFPKVGVQSTAATGSLAVLYSNYKSRYIFRLTQPLKMSSMVLNKIVVSPDENLVEMDVDGETAYCTQHYTYIDALVGPRSPSCFKSTSPGKFSSVTYQPGAIWLSKDITPAIEFTSHEIQAEGQVTPLKRELVFDGVQNGVLMFSERIYEKSLQTPSRVKPLIASVSSVPAKVSLDGMDINVIKFNDTALTFEVLQPWQ